MNKISDVTFPGSETSFLDKLTRQGRSSNTVKNYKTDLQCFNKYLQEHGNGLGLSKFTKNEITGYGHFLDKKYSSDNSKRRRIQTLRMFFDYLVEEGIYPDNPVRSLPSSPKFLDIPRPTPFIDIKTLWEYLLKEETSEDDMIKLLAIRNQIVLLLIFSSGLKVSEISKLKKSAIITTEQKNASRIMISSGKRDPYSIPIANVFNLVLKKYLPLLEEMKKRAGLEFDEILFNANPYQILSGGLSPRGLEIVFEEFRKKLILNLTPKSLRQSCIFKWIHQRKKDSLIREWMGVSPSYSLKLYRDHSSSHPYNEEFLEEMYIHFDRKKS